MPDLVIIPTAGVGSRMGVLTRDVNKALLPYKGKPALAHIIDSFHERSRFVIPVGYKGEQIKDFLRLAYPTHDITCIDITDFTSEKSGTATTLLECAPYIDQEFWYVSCDTIFQRSDIDITCVSAIHDDICWVAAVDPKDSHRYTMFETKDGKISDLSFKETKTKGWVAFTGLMRIANHKRFIKSLESSTSSEFIHSIELGTVALNLPSWIDIGTEDLYRNLCKKQGFDFSKTGEHTWICNNTVVKWWKDGSVPIKKIEKARHNQPALPKNIRSSGNMISYDLQPGSTLYESITQENLEGMLAWLDDVVWKKYDDDITNDCKIFYKNKTDGRIKNILLDDKNYPLMKKINGKTVKPPIHYYKMIDWDFLSTVNRPSWIHGDLQFDNVILGDDGNFTAIDWRQDFGESVKVGDAYYDLAKLIGGCRINYARIKSGDFSVDMDGDSVSLSFPSITGADQLVNRIEMFAESKGFDLRKINLLLPIIFWNMAPLHAYPFNLLLWYLGTLKFSDIFDHEKIH